VNRSLPHLRAPRVAFITYAAHPALTPDDAHAARALEGRGVRVDAVPWDAAPLDPAAYDALVLRSCWDYHRRPAEFLAWLEAVERAGVRLLNPPALVRWNARKTYLAELEARGVGVVPTAWAMPGDATPLARVLADRGWDDAVVKPVVSAGAFETWRTSPRAAAGDEARFAALRDASGAMVQRFVAEIDRGGEWSLLFFGGRFSHAVRKRARPGDFRVQEQYGGTATPEDPPPAVLADAHRAVAALPAPPLYARVDGVEVGGRLLLMELEVTEPSLFLAQAPGAAERFAEALVETLVEAPRNAGAPGARHGLAPLSS
jgi:glutathione synthase/RimK-type ligase-like ATP-grasp enzyme